MATTETRKREVKWDDVVVVAVETVKAIVVEGREHGGGGTVLKSEEVVSADAVAAAVDLGEQRSLEARASVPAVSEGGSDLRGVALAEALVERRRRSSRRWLRFASVPGFGSFSR